jgi:flagellar hook assembly protein FlgD
VKSVDAEVADYFGNPMDVSTRSIPANFAISNFPNPFNPSTTISLSLPQASEYSVKIYNVVGQLVQEFSGYSEAGTVEVEWNGDDVSGSKVASGMYFMKANAKGQSLTRKLVLMK